MHGERWSRGPATIATLTALVITGCSRPASEVGDGGRAAAVRFLDELRAGRLEPAWQGSSAEFKSLMGLESLRDYVKAHPALKAPAEYAETRAIDRNGRSMTECVFHATTKLRGKPATATIRVLLAPGDDGWEVEHLAVE
jgi:hypothetical protein